MRIAHVARDAAFQRLLGGEERAGASSASARAMRSTRRSPRCLAEARGGSSRSRRASAWDEALACEPHPRLMLEGEAIDRGAGRDGRLRRPDLAVPGGPFGRRGASWRPRRRGAAGSTPPRRAVRRAALVHDLGRVAVDRPDLAEAGAADRRRVGAGAAAPVPHRAGPLPLAVPVGARAGRGSATTSGSTARATTAGPPAPGSRARAAARRGRRVPRDDRAAAAPRAARARAGGASARRGGGRRPARRRRGRPPWSRRPGSVRRASSARPG